MGLPLIIYGYGTIRDILNLARLGVGESQVKWDTSAFPFL